MRIQQVILGWVKCWWHCLLRFHRMIDAQERKAGQRLWRTTWIGCHECKRTFFGTRPQCLPE